jgi:signal transduction histidine kinase
LRIGDTGETYIINRDAIAITESRFFPGAILKVKVNTEPVRAFIERGQEMIGDYRDYRGVPVSGSSAVIRQMGWVLVTEIDFSQVFAPIAALRNALAAIFALVLVAAMLVAMRFARAIIRPIRMLGIADQALAHGDERRGMASEENLPNNEIGDFIKARNVRIKLLLEHQRELLHEQKARARAAAELEHVSYGMVHNMRAPLRAIVSFGELIEAEAGERLSESERGYLERMRRSALRMDQLIRAMLKYSAMLRQEMPLSAVNVPQLLQRVIETNPAIRAHKDAIEVRPDARLVNANEAGLAECFLVLLDNALRYGKPGIAPKIKVQMETRDDWIRIWVEDNGAGMSPEFQERLFGIFQKGTQTDDGTGIGLALVRATVERMGGRVGVVSEEGTGSRFWIDLRPAQ